MQRNIYKTGSNRCTMLRPLSNNGALLSDDICIHEQKCFRVFYAALLIDFYKNRQCITISY